jgi:predicted dehydrogenase
MSRARKITRRTVLKALAAATVAGPFTYRLHAAAPSETLYHASFGAGGMAASDIASLTASRYLKLVAVADVDLTRTAELKKRYPELRVYQDWRQMLDKEKDLNTASISTPDHMHAPMTMRAMQQGLHVYTQKPLTHTVHEARQLARYAQAHQRITQMGIQIHSHHVHREVVAVLRDGVLGKVREIHSWSGKQWGDRSPRPQRSDPVPPELDWDGWLGVAAERPYIGGGYYHPFYWRKRVDFGTGTFGDMGCHILDPVFAGLELPPPRTIRSELDPPNEENWAPDAQVEFRFPPAPRLADDARLVWYSGTARPPEEVRKLLGNRSLHDQGTIYIGTEGVLYSPYIAPWVLLPEDRFKDYKRPAPGSKDHYLEFVEACRGNGTTSTPFRYSGPLTELVLLGCLATRFPKTTLAWDAEGFRFSNVPQANQFLRRPYRKGWEVEGL